MNYGKRVLIAIDQLANAIAGGSPDETFSSRCWRQEQAGSVMYGVFRRVVDTLFFFTPEHCKYSYISELNLNHFPDSMKALDALEKAQSEVAQPLSRNTKVVLLLGTGVLCGIVLLRI